MVLRNGCAEGAFQSILKYEVPLMKKGLAEVECKSAITLLVVNKLQVRKIQKQINVIKMFQQLRLFPKNINPNAKPLEQNIKPGTVVDTGIGTKYNSHHLICLFSLTVHPNWTEFYLSSHRPIQVKFNSSVHFDFIIEGNRINSALQPPPGREQYDHGYRPIDVPLSVLWPSNCIQSNFLAKSDLHRRRICICFYNKNP